MTKLKVGDYEKFVEEGCYCNWDGPLKEKSKDIITEFKIIRRTKKCVFIEKTITEGDLILRKDTIRRKILLDEEGNEIYKW